MQETLQLEVLDNVTKAENIDPKSSLELRNAFAGFFQQAQEWKSKAEKLVVTDVSQVKEMKQAREARLALKNIRCAAENKRKELKADALRYGKAVDGMGNIIKFLIEPIEEHLENQERFVERKEQERKAKLQSERQAEIMPFLNDIQYIGMMKLSDMSDLEYNAILSGFKASFEKQKAAERQAELDRIAKEKAEAEERERIRKENEELKAKIEAERIERENQDAIMAAEQAKAKAEAKRIRDEQEAIELKKKQDIEEAARKAAAAPDKEKLQFMLNNLKLVVIPTMETKAGVKVAEFAEATLKDIFFDIQTEIEKL